MKKILLTLVVVALVFVGQAFSADIFNQGTTRDLRSTTLSSYDNVCGYYEHGDQVTYVFKTTWVDSSNARHSKPFYIGDLNYNDAYVRAIMSAASDCNTIYHFSYDNRNTWVTETPASLDALSSTAAGDTLGVTTGGANDVTGFHSGVWMVIEAKAGSTALNDDEVYTWVGSFQRDYNSDPNLPRMVGAARIANSSNTNP
jgi:hypothetical protein